MFNDKGIFWNLVSLVVLGISGVLINSMILYFRGEEAVGIFNQAYAIYIVFSQIGVAGIQYSVLNRLSLTTDDPEKSGRITGAALLLALFFTSLIAGLGYLISPFVGKFLNSPDVASSMAWLMPGLVFFCLNKILINVVNAFEKMIAYAVFRSIRFVLIPGFIGAIIFIGLDNYFLAASFSMAEVILFIALLIYIRTTLFRVRLPITKEYYQQHLAFSSKGFFSGILVELNTRLDVLLLGYFVDDYSVGVYSFVATLAEGFSQFSNALRWNIDPELGRLLNKDDKPGIISLVNSIRRDYYKLFILGGTIIILAFPFAYRILIGSYDWLSALMFAVMMIGVIFGAWYRPFSGLMLQGGKPGVYTIYVLLLLLGDGVLNLLLIPYLGILGAAIVTMITYILEGLYLKWVASRLFSLKI